MKLYEVTRTTHTSGPALGWKDNDLMVALKEDTEV